ncbi:MAG: hypothetical protein M1285_05630 [Candidatus Thermoplasmatota archaeon]|nr:hypothetical protein [Candidatus Thermoplasmatota archaeon]
METSKEVEKMMNTGIGSWTENQRKKLFSLMNKEDFSKEDMEASLKFPMSELSVAEASKLIDCFISNGDLSIAVGQVREMHTKAPKGPLDSVPESKEESKEPEHKEPEKPMDIPKSREEAIARKQQSQQTQEVAVKPEPKNPMVVEKASSRPELMAKMWGIPPELADMYFMIIDGKLYVKNPGLLYMGAKKGYAKIVAISKEDGDGGYDAEARIYPKIPIDFLKAIAVFDPEMQKRLLDEQYGPTIERGKANKENVKNSKMAPFMEELARTRAVDRALRLFTGYGGTAYEELPDAELQEQDFKNIRKAERVDSQ